VNIVIDIFAAIGIVGTGVAGILAALFAATKTGKAQK
jgi:hypothetical protein